ncbi:hypothetical protein K503DRAFT_814058 [Rhizopogon vinicolor AM-OR11-026]|uniref:Heterokaryon incompatibility domain-containing protein n=1 Tax=Rhizopogon vinicolor AM-OR11-026 TaxID=1314800 RepID=A0A1B7MFA6_9AGAM|nr:hypothetical protein K503DRAFT_814058 [Rhizopogon vinicolor AM-OR11-026]
MSHSHGLPVAHAFSQRAILTIPQYGNGIHRHVDYDTSGLAELAVSGDAALAAGAYDWAIELYSAAIDPDYATDIIFSNRCQAKFKKNYGMKLLSMRRRCGGICRFVTELNSSSYLGYELKHAALHGGERCATLWTRKHKLRQQYVGSSEAADAIEEAIRAELDNNPHRLLNTSTGRLCDRQAQINAFKTSAEYEELVSSTMKHADLRMERIENAVVTYFRYVMLSHRWGENELLLQDIQDKTNNVGVRESVNSMFVWYRHSSLTIIYLPDVPPSSKSGALTRSIWNKRGWTVQEFLAPKIVLFYQKDWTLYLDDHSPNHNDSAAIMRELGDATGIDTQALVTFRPGMRGAREELQSVSMRVTTLQEDIAYSLFGIFSVNLPVIYGEKKQNALGRLLLGVVAQSGDTTCLDWVGKPSDFNSCLPACITSYGAPPFMQLSALSEDKMQTSVSSLRGSGVVELASQLYTTLDDLTAPRFAHRRLHLPCIIFPVTEVTLRSGQEQETYLTHEVKADGLCDVLITTEDNLIPFSRVMPIRQKFLLVRPWDRNLLELSDSAKPFNLADDAQSIMSEDYQTLPTSPMCDSSDMHSGEHAPIVSESDSRALRLIVGLGQPFGAAVEWRIQRNRVRS